MISTTPFVIASLLGAALTVEAQVVSVRSETFVPAGTLLDCTIDEPNFSSQTAQRGDPVLCKITSAVEMSGRALIPRGSYLSANLGNYHDPGHFVGKGWIQLEFASLILPGGSVPLDAKVISADRYRVSKDGRILGRGHPVRDAIEWAIPILWPIKVLTLPVRGPRPTLKGETRIQLRLMEDLSIPESTDSTSAVPTPTSSASQLGTDDRGGTRLAPRPRSVWRDYDTLPVRQPVDSSAIDYHTPPVTNRGWPSAPPSHYTLLALRNGQVYIVTDYSINNGNLRYTTGGEVYVMPLDALDVPLTRRLNTERGVLFTFAPKNR
jgi:hypothetical protein